MFVDNIALVNFEDNWEKLKHCRNRFTMTGWKKSIITFHKKIGLHANSYYMFTATCWI